MAEAWEKRRHASHAISALSNARSECLETLTWLGFAQKCGYANEETTKELSQVLDEVASILYSMTVDPESWQPRSRRSE